MADLPGTGLATRQRRLEAFWNRVTLIVGCAAVVGIVASVVLVITKQVMKEPLVEADYLTQAGRGNEGVVTWSKRSAGEKSLMETFSTKQTVSRDMEAAKQAAAYAEAATKGSPSEEAAIAAAAAPASLPAGVGPADKAKDQAPAAIPLSIADAVKAQPLAAGIDDIEDKREAIANVLESFFTAKGMEERLLMVRDPERVKPLMKSYYARAPLHAAKFRGLGRTVRVDEPGHRFGYVQALFEDSTPASLIVEETSGGGFLIDWECLVRYGELSWVDFLRMRPVEPKLLRVLASRAVGSPSVTALAPATSLWLELRHPEEGGAVLGYFDRNDPKFRPLVEQLQQGNWKDVPVTLRLCFPTAPTRLDGAGVHIAGVEGKGWLILNDQKTGG